jgi:hypothetical protein
LESERQVAETSITAGESAVDDSTNDNPTTTSSKEKESASTKMDSQNDEGKTGTLS